MTESSLQALSGLWDFTMLKWYVIPLLAFVLYVYTKEVREARASGNWNALFAGLTLFGEEIRP